MKKNIFFLISMVTFLTFTMEDHLQMQKSDPPPGNKTQSVSEPGINGLELRNCHTGASLTDVLENKINSPVASSSKTQRFSPSKVLGISCNGITQTLFFGGVFISTCYAVTLRDK